MRIIKHNGNRELPKPSDEGKCFVIEWRGRKFTAFWKVNAFHIVIPFQSVGKDGSKIIPEEFYNEIVWWEEVENKTADAWQVSDV